MGMREFYQKAAFFFCILLLLFTQSAPIYGLAAGLALSLLLGTPYPKAALSIFSGPMLKLAVIGLGFGLNLDQVIATGRLGLEASLMILGIIGLLGFIMAKLLKLNLRTAMLISSGTAICGGSAIAALSPIVGARNNEISISLAVVFILNAIALLVFPLLGRLLELNDAQFAWWAAMAIHDTSSVVGAASQFSDQSLVLATAVKLTRTLWIIPVSLVAAFALQADRKKLSIPYFILFFILAAILATYIPFFQSIAPVISQGSKALFTIVLFLIGISLDKSIFREMGIKPVLYGATLWMVAGIASLLIILGCCYYARF